MTNNIKNKCILKTNTTRNPSLSGKRKVFKAILLELRKFNGRDINGNFRINDFLIALHEPQCLWVSFKSVKIIICIHLVELMIKQKDELPTPYGRLTNEHPWKISFQLSLYLLWIFSPVSWKARKRIQKIMASHVVNRIIKYCKWDNWPQFELTTTKNASITH